MDRHIKAELRHLPSVDAVLKTRAAEPLIDRHGRRAATEAVRQVISEARAALREGAAETVGAEGLAVRAASRLDMANRSSMRPVINLTGTVLHTNFGRAILADAAIEAATVAMREPVALEYDLDSGKRGERDDHVRALLVELTGAEDATVVNNNAAAVLLALNTLALGRDVVVSRGELIEIGGAFRMPDVMERAGVRLAEVGTTNRTHSKDYAAALTAATGAILKVHTSNYRIMGFTSEVRTSELATIAANATVPLMNDLGSGTLIDLARYGLEREPTVRDAAAYADLVTFSGDKLLGGPQAGFIVGKRAWIEKINRNPLKRALRVDKVRLAAIEATLRVYRDPDRLADRLPTLRFLARPQAEIRKQAERLLPKIAAVLEPTFSVDLHDCRSQIGSGALPLDTLPSCGLQVESKTGGHGLEKLTTALRTLSRPIVGRFEDGRLVLDLRCLGDEDAFLSSLSELSL